MPFDPMVHGGLFLAAFLAATLLPLQSEAALVALLLAYAWIDGGEEALHPIVQPIDVPEHAR